MYHAGYQEMSKCHILFVNENLSCEMLMILTNTNNNNQKYWIFHVLAQGTITCQRVSSIGGACRQLYISYELV